MERKYMENFKDEECDTKIKNEPVVVSIQCLGARRHYDQLWKN